MMSVAMETCCKSMFTMCAIPAVIASVIGMDNAISNVERHSQNPTVSAINTTNPMASVKGFHE